MGNGDASILLISIVSHCKVFIYKQGNKKEVAKGGMPHLLNKKKCFFFITVATPDTSPNKKEI